VTNWQKEFCNDSAAPLDGAVSRTLHVLTGCTAVGKTELALRWAEANGAEIVSCDSLLFYRGADIGTAKPGPAERARVPHHLIDIAEPAEQMNVSHYVTLARGAVEDILRRGRAVLVTGGSGFYLKAFFAPVADEVAVPAALRAEVAARLEREGLEAVVAELRALNPGGLGTLDVRNPRRVVRALERCRATGRTLADLQAEFAARPGPFADCVVRVCELVREPADLEARIARRVDGMLAAGLVEEVRGLLARGARQNPSVAGAIGYRETIDFLEGRLPAAELAGAIVRNTRALVKKQRTWFRTQLPPHRRVPAATAGVQELFG
jgi:tRNA dimethylallyltransferase